ncbi:LysR family transcriptional regulator [Ochrobactrum sp. 695/2009]|nr:transcriptional regulator GcvA [Brucella intermedia]PJR92439.1 LysR family transcriptional regulator [Ochrobactrum sp. 721/2009]PJT15737.1 LysR family transcriptional regulator [Ochrobactrum sp. 720/2009]PJT23901.1 LysR family transcriptional regulator [Ochrobactrum sp. 715/2009]PJT24045.1 LysR family transcriptional regulator [Ochrobactrum sp. 695/2009]PJT33576.1 LysR family transcriptional regulator [Ochrobactrum sp. 689/2009]
MLQHLPPLQTFKAFEATARRLSMTLAAEELCLTHGAVSRQIRTLEDDLGVRLFHRMTLRIELTEQGALFFSAVTRLLAELSRAAESLRQKPDDTQLVVSTGVSFASKWLTQRLHRLVARYPEFHIQLEVTDADLDFARGKVDVAIRYGTGQYPNATAERIMNETVSPVCSPQYLERIDSISSPRDLLQCQLVHENGLQANWQNWFALAGIPAVQTRGHGFSHGSMAIDAAIRGEGIALGRSVLVAEDLAASRLVELFPVYRLDVEHGYDLVYGIGNENHPKVQAVRGWLLDEFS